VQIQEKLSVGAVLATEKDHFDLIFFRGLSKINTLADLPHFPVDFL
jgi:hypothetical protein